RVAAARRADRRAHRVREPARQGQPLLGARAQRRALAMAIRVVVIEDNPANLELMTYLLRAYKFEPLPAVSGEEGVETVLRERPDLVLCDIQLPKMDGFEVLRRLKAEPGFERIP